LKGRPYHSGLKNSGIVVPDLVFRSGTTILPNGIALVHDISTGTLPEAFSECDAIYSEMPWRAGYDEFNNRAGMNNAIPFNEFINKVNAVIAQLEIPIFLVWSKTLKNRVAPDAYIQPVTLHKQPAVIFAWNVDGFDLPFEWPDYVQAICKKYNCIGDWCCGYGSTAYYAHQEKKRTVASDVNRNCINYLADESQGWK